MSAKIMGQVWDYELTKREQAILLALADHADHDGSSVRPSVAKLSWKCGLSERTVQRALSDFRLRGVLIVTRKARQHRATEYRIVLRVLRKKPPFPVRGDKLSPLKDGPGVTITPVRGDKTSVRGDKYMSPEPSYEPSILNPRSEDRPGRREGLRHIGSAIASAAEAATP